MTTIYLVSNNCFLNELLLYKDYIDLDTKRKYRPLTINGEKVAVSLAKKKTFQDTEAIYSSTFFSSINTAKYLSEKINKELIIDKRLDDRLVGYLYDSTLNLRNLQEHDFDYKLSNGESLNNVKQRMVEVLKEIVRDYEDSKVVIYTHNIAILSLLTVWCQKGFNYEEKMILDYNDHVIMDGLYSDSNIIELTFEGETIKNIKRVD